MTKTARIQWLLDHVGELEGDDLKEAQDMIDRQHDGYWVEMSDEEPVAYDRPIKKRLQPDESYPELVNIPPSTEMPSDDILVRLNQLEAVTKDLFAKLKALEAKVL